MESIDSIAMQVLQIPELAVLIIEYCNVLSARQLTAVNRALYQQRTNKILWRNKVQQEFGLVKFKPEWCDYTQQYLSLSNCTMESAVKLGRCDQLRLLRRSEAFSYFDAAVLAIQHDQAHIVHYLIEYENYVLPVHDWTTEDKLLGPRMVSYLFIQGKQGKLADNIRKDYSIILTTAVNKSLTKEAQAMFEQLVRTSSRTTMFDNCITNKHTMTQRSL